MPDRSQLTAEQLQNVLAGSRPGVWLIVALESGDPQVIAQSDTEATARAFASVRGGLVIRAVGAAGEARILLIEPDHLHGNWLAVLLRQAIERCDVLQYPTVVQALASLRTDEHPRIDLVIVSYALPFMHVSEALERLRAMECLRHTPFVVTVASEGEAQQVKGAAAFLFRPVDEVQIGRVLGLVRAD